MSSHQVPSKSEVRDWNPQQLANFLKKLKLSGCDKAVIKNSIDGARFVNLSENDLQKFPKTYAPLISKLSIDISKKVEKRIGIGSIFTSKPHEPETVSDGGGWEDDEFDEFDDYESPCSGNDGSGDDYESPIEDHDMDHGPNPGLDEDDDPDYEPPPSEPPEDFSHNLTSRPIENVIYIDGKSRGPPPAPCPRPPVSTPPNRKPAEPSPRRDVSPHCGPKPSGKLVPPQPPQVFRGNKPGRDLAQSRSPVRGAQRNTMEKPLTHPWRPQQDVPEPQSWSKPSVLPSPSAAVARSNSSARPPPNRFENRREQTPNEATKHNTFPLQIKSPRPGPPLARHTDSLPPGLPSGPSLQYKPPSGRVPSPERASLRPPPSTGFNTNQELDPLWYVGRVTRGQAEASLQRLRKDGAYVVRDSTKQSAGQPYTLMVFYQDKVYNIQIREQNQSFLLGTGLKVQEYFRSVRDIVVHYSQSPLLLIDAKNRGNSQQNQCLLSDPAGTHLQAQNWT